MNTYLFLDIDGVLNNTATRLANECRFHHVCTYYGRPLQKSDLDIDEVNIALVIKLIEDYNMKVVITSMWRFGAKIEWFQQLFKLYGLDLDVNRLDMITCEDYECDEGMRSQFIETYIKNNNCNEYICLDDTVEHFDRLLDKTVLTDIRYGFTQSDYKKAVEILEYQNKHDN